MFFVFTIETSEFKINHLWSESGKTLNDLVLQVLLTVTIKVTLVWRIYLSKLNATNQWETTFRRPWGRLNDKGLRDVAVRWLKNIESVVMLMMGESSQVRSASPDPPLTVYSALMSSLSA